MDQAKPAKDGRKRWKGRGKEYVLRDFPAASVHASPLVNALLVSRGIETPEDADAFLNPDYDFHVHDPFLLKGMEEASARILKAMKDGELIAVYSDYDADGIPGGVILHDFFKKAGYENFTNYIPHRHDEGFGLNMDAVEKLAARGAKLIVTVDCGIADVGEVARAGELGIDVIVTDHHIPGAELPPAAAIVDPKQEGCTYPFKDLCGAGVAWKLVQALIARGDFGIKDGWEKWLLDMAGLATLSDMVPLVGENRVIAFYGLKVLRKTPRLGLVKLARKLRVELRHLTEDDIGFTITPRINAASRMGMPMDAFSLLATADENEAERLAGHLDKINDERKGIVAAIVRDVKKHFAERHEAGEMKRVLVAGNPEWRPSLLGLVANSLVEEYRRPVFLWGRDGGQVLKGSCRSDGIANVVELMDKAKHVFIDYGGHKMSGGFSVSVDTLHLVEDELSKACEELGASAPRGDETPVDKILTLDDVSWETYSHIEKLAPYGLGNPKPLFAFEGARVEGVRLFGKGDLHLELTFKNSRGQAVSAIAFFSKPESMTVLPEAGKSVTLIAAMEKSMFRNTPELRLRIADVC